MLPFREYCRKNFHDTDSVSLDFWDSCLQVTQAFPWRDASILDAGSASPIHTFAIEELGAKAGRFLNHMGELSAIPENSADIVLFLNGFRRLAREPLYTTDGTITGHPHSLAMFALREIARIAKEGAKVLVTVENAGSMERLWRWIEQRPPKADEVSFTVGELQSLCATAGLACLSLETREPSSLDELSRYRNGLVLRALSSFGVAEDLRGQTILGVFTVRRSLLRD